MISIKWNTTTGAPCPTCNQPITTKRKSLTLFGVIPIPLGKPTSSCGCASSDGQPADQQKV
jgi:hypothetical protein